MGYSNLMTACLLPSTYSTMVLKQQLQATVYSLTLLVTVTPLVPAQSLQLVYIDRPDDNRILLECRQPVTSVAVTSPQIWVERFDLARQPVTIVGNQAGTVAIEITQDLEGFYSCSYNGDRSSNTLQLVGKESCHHYEVSYILYAYSIL